MILFSQPPDSFDLSKFRQFWAPENYERNSGDFGGDNWSLMSAVLTANSAQLMITASYYFYNSV